MPVESADDLAVFFDPEEFGSSALYTAAGAAPREIGVIHDQAVGESRYGQIVVAPGTHVLRIQRADVARPAADDVVTIDGVGPLTIIGDVYPDRGGALWICFAVGGGL